jgi:hypothetical protein
MRSVEDDTTINQDERAATVDELNQRSLEAKSAREWADDGTEAKHVSDTRK